MKDGACRNIVNENAQGGLLSIEELLIIGRTAIDCGINKIRLTGGEPLVRSDVLKLCEGLKSINGLDELNITTNGARLYEMASDLKDTGVDRINISLDTLNEEKYRKITRIGSIDKVLNGLEEAQKVGFKDTKINVVLMAGVNDDEIKDFVNITKNYPVGVRFIELMPIGASKEWYDERYISTNTVLERVPELSEIGKSGVSRVYKLKDALGTVGLISPISQCFCNECNRLRITSDGRLLPCLHSSLQYNIRGLSVNELIDVFNLAIKNKPEGHHIAKNHESDNKDYMNIIGG